MQDIVNYARPGTPTILVGTKRDLESRRAISYWDAADAAFQMGIEYMETSAKTGLNVLEVFQTISKKALIALRPPSPLKTSKKKKAKDTEPNSRGSTPRSNSGPASPKGSMRNNSNSNSSKAETPFDARPHKKRSCIIL